MSVSLSVPVQQPTKDQVPVPTQAVQVATVTQVPAVPTKGEVVGLPKPVPINVQEQLTNSYNNKWKPGMKRFFNRKSNIRKIIGAIIIITLLIVFFFGRNKSAVNPLTNLGAATPVVANLVSTASPTASAIAVPAAATVTGLPPIAAKIAKLKYFSQL